MEKTRLDRVYENVQHYTFKHIGVVAFLNFGLRCGSLILTLFVGKHVRGASVNNLSVLKIN